MSSLLLIEPTEIIKGYAKNIRQWSLDFWTQLYQIFSYFWLLAGIYKSNYQTTRLPTFDKRTRLHDVALLVEKRELWYSRQVLSIHSPLMDSLLNPKNSTPNQPAIDRVPIHGTSYEEVLCLLRCLTPGDTFMYFDDSNVLALGRAAKVLEIGEVTKRCKRFLTERCLALIEDGDPRIIDLLVIVSQLYYRPLLDFLVLKTAEELTFEDIKKRYKELPPMVVAALYDVKLSNQIRQSHDWWPSSTRFDETCECGEDALDLGRRCRRCKKVCCNMCFENGGLGTRGNCEFCGECGAQIEGAIGNTNMQLVKKKCDEPSMSLCRCRPRVSSVLLGQF